MLINSKTRYTSRLPFIPVDTQNRARHIICLIIHVREYDSRRAKQQGPIRTLTAALKRSIKTVTGCIFYHTNKNITNEKN